MKHFKSSAGMLFSFSCLLPYLREEAEALAKRLKLRFYRTSVKENLNVEEVFRYLTEKYIERMSAITDDNATTSAKIGKFI